WRSKPRSASSRSDRRWVPSVATTGYPHILRVSWSNDPSTTITVGELRASSSPSKGLAPGRPNCPGASSGRSLSQRRCSSDRGRSGELLRRCTEWPECWASEMLDRRAKADIIGEHDELQDVPA